MMLLPFLVILFVFQSTRRQKQIYYVYSVDLYRNGHCMGGVKTPPSMTTYLLSLPSVACVPLKEYISLVEGTVTSHRPTQN